MSSPPSSPLRLPPALDALVQARLAAGGYADAEAVLEAALRLLAAAPEPAPPGHALLLRLEKRLQGLGGTEAMAAAAAMLGEALGLARVSFTELTPEGLAAGWSPAGPVAPPALPPALLAAVAEGQPLALSGEAADARLPDGAPALLAAPRLEDGRLSGLLLAEAPAPRAWRRRELALAAEFAARLAAALRRARMEAALQESEQRYRTLFDACPFAIIIIDTATHAVLDVNENACESYGYTREEFLRLRIGDIDTRREPEAIRAHARGFTLRPGVQQFEAQHRDRAGRVRDVLVRVHGLQLGGRGITYGAHVDITDRKAAEAALRQSEARLRLALQAGRLGTWEFDLAAGRGRRAGPLAEALPQVAAEGFDLAEWLAPIHPEDRAAVQAGFEALARDEREEFRAEFRVRRPGAAVGGAAACGAASCGAEGEPGEIQQGMAGSAWIWISSHGAVAERDAAGRPCRIAGVAQDCTERKLAEERQALLTREVDHRAKNALAVVQAALRLTRAETLPLYRRAVEGRVAALARAQTLLAEDRWAGADLAALLRGEIEPFLAGRAQALRLAGPAVLLPAAAAQPLAMAMHELATNATKHGALSVPQGEVAIAWSVDDSTERRLHLRWQEHGGPRLPGPPARRGFGARVMEATLRGQLGGALALDWAEGGLLCQLELPLQRAAGGGPPPAGAVAGVLADPAGGGG
ncbi:PAS domain S-box protein [Roseomonas sp. USHLN139]|uniref:PAS domain S-box protein n=1 Tax=Roseomonas sp. USHLN139 TaxID=3081298 RepID=UPI003B012CE4